jgi:hypothetical protein
VDVVMSQRAGWFLLVDNEHHYLDVNCSRSFVGFSILVQLTDEEETELHALGRTFVSYLAAKIAYWPDRYRSRDLSLGPAAHEAYEAAMRWLAQPENDPTAT